MGYGARAMGRSIHSKPAVSAWLIRERKRMGWKPRDVAEALTMRGLPVQEGTVRTWEAGRNPSPENVEGLEAIFESRSPASGPADATPVGLDALVAFQQQLVAAFETQAQAVMALVEEIRLARAVEVEDILARVRVLEATQRALHPELTGQEPSALPVPRATEE